MNDPENPRSEIGAAAIIQPISPNPQDDFVDLIGNIARDDPDRPAMIFAKSELNGSRQQVSFAELLERAEKIATGLQKRGVTKSTRVLMLLKPGYDFVAVSLALHRLGAVPILIDMGMGIRRMLGCIDECKPEIMIGIPKAFWLRWIFPRYFRSVQWAVISRRSFFWPNAVSVQSLENSPGKFSLTNPPESSDITTIVFTSGSTGVAKGVELTHQQILDRQRVREQSDGLPAGSIELATFPAFLLMSLASGRTCVIPEMDMTRPGQANPGKLVFAMQKFQADNFFASPALLVRLTDYCVEHNVTLPQVKFVVTGGAPIAFDVLEKMQTIAPGAEIRIAYGATEALPISGISFEEVCRETIALTRNGKGACVGHPIPETEVAIIRNTEEPIQSWSEELRLQQNEIGEIVVRGCCVTNRYFQRDDLTRVTSISDTNSGLPWYRTGDLGCLDSDGRIWLAGRKKHLVQAGDRNYYPVQIEGILNEIQDVKRTALVGVVQKGSVRPAILFERSGGQGPAKMIGDTIRDKLQEHNIEINIVIHYPGKFPVDKRHNSKIERLELAKWAQKRV